MRFHCSSPDCDGQNGSAQRDRERETTRREGHLKIWSTTPISLRITSDRHVWSTCVPVPGTRRTPGISVIL